MTNGGKSGLTIYISAKIYLEDTACDALESLSSLCSSVYFIRFNGNRNTNKLAGTNPCLRSDRPGAYKDALIVYKSGTQQ